MSDACVTPDSREDVFGRFFEDLETAPDKEAVVRQYAAAHPRWSADFREEAAIELLVHAKPAPGEPYPEGLPDFHILRKVAEGGMGVVYEAEQLSLHRRVALKVRRQRLSADAQKRFDREQETLARLHQTHIVPVHTAGQVGPWQYFAMAYIEGAALSRLVRTAFQRETAGHAGKTPPLAELAGEMVRQSKGETPVSSAAPPSTAPSERVNLSEKETIASLHSTKVTLSLDYFRSVARVMADAAEALEHAHEKHILHRDVKPSNLMIDTDGKCWLIDFGLAYCNGTTGTPHVQASENADAALTAGPLGTPGYMAPEQYRARAEKRSDVWGLGVTLYELLTLRPAFEGRTQEEVRAKVLAEEPTPLRELAEGVPADLVAICRKAMRKEAGQRYATAGEFAEDLRRWLRYEPTKARPVWVGRRVWLWAKRNKGWAAAILVAFLSVASLTAAEFAAAKSRVKLAESEAETASEKERVANLEMEAARQQTEAVQNQLDLIDFMRGRQHPRAIDWSKGTWERGKKFIERTDKGVIRNHMAATLIGMDAERVKTTDTFNAGSAVWDSRGQRLLLGGALSTPARIWNSRTDEMHVLRRWGAGPVAFQENDVPVQVVLKSKDPLTFVLMDLAGSTPLHEFPMPGLKAAKPQSAPRIRTMLSANGTHFAAAVVVNVSLTEQTGILAVWEMTSGKLLRKEEVLATALAFAPDGSHLAAGDSKGQISVFPLPTGEPLKLQGWNHVTIHALAFGRDPLWRLEDQLFRNRWVLAVGDAASRMAVWDLELRQPRMFYTGSEYLIRALAFSPDGMTLAASGLNHPILWDVASGQPLLKLYGRSKVTDVAFSSDGLHLAVTSVPNYGTQGGGFDVYELDNVRRGIQTLRGLGGQAERVWLSQDSRLVAAFSHEWRIGLWDREKNRLLYVLQVPEGITADNADAAFSKDGKRLAFVAGSNALLWDLDRRELILQRKNLPWGVHDRLVFTTDGKLLLGREVIDNGTAERPVSNPIRYQIRDLLRNDWQKPLVELAEFPFGYLHAELAPDGSFFTVEARTSADGNRVLAAYELPSGKPLWQKPYQVAKEHAGNSATHHLDPTGTRLAFTPGFMNSRTVLEMPSGKFVGILEGYAQELSPDVRYWSNIPAVVPGSLSPFGVALFGSADKTPLVTLGIDTSAGSLSQRFNQEGNLLAWGTPLGAVHVCDIQEVRRRLTTIGLGW